MFPFAIKHNAVDMTRLSDMTWLGRVDSMYLGLYVDTAIMLLLGGTSWQVCHEITHVVLHFIYNIIQLIETYLVVFNHMID